jgi:hypothetical protein
MRIRMKHEILFIYIKTELEFVDEVFLSLSNRLRTGKRKRKKNLSRRIEIVYLKELREEKGMLGVKFFFSR